MADSIIGKISVGDGATFTPDVTDGVLSFTNNKNLPNPEPYNIAAKVLDEGENELRTLVTAAETAAGNAATSETNAHNSEQAAKASETAAATSASAAKTSETNAASSETAAATSATNAATSETNASNSASAAATSESNASDSATAAAASAAEVEAALDDYLPLSGGTLTGVVNGVTPTAGDNSTKIATTEFVNATALTCQQKKWKDSSKWESNTIQSIAQAFPDDHPDVYSYGVKVTLGKISSEEGHTNLYFPHNGGMCLKNYWGDANSSGWLTMLNDQNYSQFALPKNGTAVKATADAAGNNIQTTYAKKSDLSTAAPTGVVQAFAGSTTPQGWLLCDGSAVSRTDYAALFAVIGTTYGKGNGSTTFNLPNLVDKFIEGSATAGTVKSAGLPNITGSYIIELYNPSSASQGAYNVTPAPDADERRTVQHGSNMRWATVNFNASRSNAIYGASNTVQPPALTMRYIIKY